LTNLRPPGAPDGISVEAVPHAVGYDRARKLWYCDIVVRPGDAYFPFIRLALARYQPHSRSGMELSSVAMAAFQQLAPDRVATLSTVTGFGGRRRRIAVHGKLPGAGTPRPAAGAISVQLQRLVPGGDPDLDWRDTPQGPAPAAGPNAGPLGRRIGSMGSAFHIARNALTVEQRSLVRLGEQLLGAGDFTAVLARPDLVELLLPPLIYEETFQLPLPSGDRLRLLVTERETYSIDAENGGRSLGTRERIVYAAAIEL
jgi:hypothetical protein